MSGPAAQLSWLRPAAVVDSSAAAGSSVPEQPSLTALLDRLAAADGDIHTAQAARAAELDQITALEQQLDDYEARKAALRQGYDRLYKAHAGPQRLQLASAVCALESYLRSLDAQLDEIARFTAASAAAQAQDVAELQGRKAQLERTYLEQRDAIDTLDRIQLDRQNAASVAHPAATNNHGAASSVEASVARSGISSSAFRSQTVASQQLEELSPADSLRRSLTVGGAERDGMSWALEANDCTAADLAALEADTARWRRRVEQLRAMAAPLTRASTLASAASIADPLAVLRRQQNVIPPPPSRHQAGSSAARQPTSADGLSPAGSGGVAVPSPERAVTEAFVPVPSGRLRLLTTSAGSGLRAMRERHSVAAEVVSVGGGIGVAAAPAASSCEFTIFVRGFRQGVDAFVKEATQLLSGSALRARAA
jgi:hypothetical protein